MTLFHGMLIGSFLRVSEQTHHSEAYEIYEKFDQNMDKNKNVYRLIFYSVDGLLPSEKEVLKKYHAYCEKKGETTPEG